MNTIACVRRASPSALAAIVCMALGGAVAAQSTVQELTVEAPRSVTTRFEPTPSGAQMQITTIKVRVNYADLDLTKSSDFAMLKTRIRLAANGACAQLDKLYPETPDPNCPHRATVTATSQAEDANVAAVVRTLR